MFNWKKGKPPKSVENAWLTVRRDGIDHVVLGSIYDDGSWYDSRSWDCAEVVDPIEPDMEIIAWCEYVIPEPYNPDELPRDYFIGTHSDGVKETYTPTQAKSLLDFMLFTKVDDKEVSVKLEAMLPRNELN